MTIIEDDGVVQTFAFTYPAVAPALKSDFPEVIETVRFRRQSGTVITAKDQYLENSTLFYVDKSIWKVFDFKFLRGNPISAFQEINNVVLTESTALKYFGNTDVIGNIIEYRDNQYNVSAVIEDLPPNSHIDFNLLFNYDKYIQDTKGNAETSWGWSDFYTYALLKSDTNISLLEKKLKDFAQKYKGEAMNKYGYTIDFQLQPLTSIHLSSNYDYEFEGNGDKDYFVYLEIAAWALLLIGFINFINLGSAKSLDRFKEMGIKKTLGASRYTLIKQILFESILLEFVSFLFGILLFWSSLAFFGLLVNVPLMSLMNTGFAFWIYSILALCLLAVLSSLYPSFLLSSSNALQMLKANRVPKTSIFGKFLRQGLVVVQFGASVVLIATALGFHKQIDFMHSKDLGVDIRNVLVLEQNLRQDSATISSINAFKNNLLSNPQVLKVTASSDVPGTEVGSSNDYSLEGKDGINRCRVMRIDEDYLDFYKILIIAGEKFGDDQAIREENGLKEVLVNQRAVETFGFSSSEQIVGRIIQSGNDRMLVKGVVENYHQQSIKFNFDPVLIFYGKPFELYRYSVKYREGSEQTLLPFLEQKWKNSFAQSPFSYYNLQEKYNLQYQSDVLFYQVILLFTVIAIIVACLGLFALSLFSIRKRLKEISVRKLLGADVPRIMGLILEHYLKLIGIASFIALPISYLVLSKWLEQFAYKINIGVWFFTLPILCIVVVTLVTVSLNSFRAAKINPVRHLRGE